MDSKTAIIIYSELYLFLYVNTLTIQLITLCYQSLLSILINKYEL